MEALFYTGLVDVNFGVFFGLDLGVRDGECSGDGSDAVCGSPAAALALAVHKQHVLALPTPD